MAFHALRAGNLPDRAIEIARVREVDRGDLGDGARLNILRMHLRPQRQPNQNRQFGAGIISGHIFRRIGLGVAQRLGLGQHCGVFGASLHLAENEVAGAVQNSFHAVDTVAGKTVLKAGNDRDASCDGSAVQEMKAVRCGHRFKFETVVGNQLLVRGDDAFSGGERAAYPASRRLQSAGQLDDHVRASRGTREDGRRIIRPDDRTRNPIDLLTGEIPVDDVSQLQPRRGGFNKDASHRTTNRAKAEDGDAKRTRRKCRERRRNLRRALRHGDFLLLETFVYCIRVRNHGAKESEKSRFPDDT